MTEAEGIAWLKAASRDHWGMIPKSSERIAAICALVAAGWSKQKISAQFRVGVGTVSNDAKAINPLPAPPPTKERNMAMFAAYQAGASIAELIKTYGLCRQRIYQIIQRQLLLSKIAAAKAAEVEERRAAIALAKQEQAEMRARIAAARYSYALDAGLFVPLEQFQTIHTPATEWAAIQGERA